MIVVNKYNLINNNSFNNNLIYNNLINNNSFYKIHRKESNFHKVHYINNKIKVQMFVKEIKVLNIKIRYFYKVPHNIKIN